MKDKNLSARSKISPHYRDLYKIFNIRTSAQLNRLIDVELETVYKLVKSKKSTTLRNKAKCKKISLEDALYRRIGIIKQRLLKAISKEYFHNAKFKNKLLIIIEKARNGSDWDLFKLIKFDKCWLLIDWVQKRVVKAQEDDNKVFFDGLSDAVKYKKKSRLGKNQDDADLISTIHKLGELKYLFKMPAGEFREWLYKKLHDYTLCHPSELKFQFTKTEFKQYLRRHNI